MIGEHSYFVYDPIIYYQKIKVYRVERMDMGRFFWNNGVNGKWNTSKYCVLYGIRYFGGSHIVLNHDTLLTHYWHIESYIELCTIRINIFVLCLMAYYHIKIKKLHPLWGVYHCLPTFSTRAYIWFTKSIISSLQLF